MNFLRENVFFIALIGGVVLALVVSVVIGSGPRGDMVEDLAKRQDKYDDLGKLGKGEKVNERVLKDRQGWVKDVEKKVKEVKTNAVRWNKRNYQVLQLQLTDGRIVRAFPVDRDLYEEEVLMEPFTRRYRESCLALLEPLHVTRPAYVDRDVKLEAERLRKERPDPKRPSSGGREDPLEIEAQARAMLKKARSGWIYIEDEDKALDLRFPQPSHLARFDELWEAQVNLWVTGDVVTAIRMTNEAGMKDVPEAQRNILTAPVKRLVKIAIEESYYTGREPEDWYKGTRDSGVSSSSFAGSQQAEATEIRTLTERACCPRYDVVRYRFTVVMSTPQVQVLLYNLMARNYHTVMKVEMQTVKADPSPQALYHYGPDAVLEVTVYGEVLLLTDWERGTRDETKGEWSQEYPPLMPVEMLKSIQIRRSSALRPEDNTRIEESPG